MLATDASEFAYGSLFPLLASAKYPITSHVSTCHVFGGLQKGLSIRNELTRLQEAWHHAEGNGWLKENNAF